VKKTPLSNALDPKSRWPFETAFDVKEEFEKSLAEKRRGKAIGGNLISKNHRDAHWGEGAEDY